MPRLRRTRIPKLNHTKVRKLVFYASYTDLGTGTHRKKIFGNIPKPEAQLLY